MNDHELYLRANAFARDVVSRIDESALANQTPCADWDVRGTVNHLIGGQHFFLSVARGEPAGGHGTEAPDFVAMGDAAEQLAELGPQIAEAFTEEAMGRMFDGPAGPMPVGMFLKIATMENALHAWDAARGAGLDVQIPDEVVEPLTALVTSFNPDGSNPDFAAPVPVPDDASPQDRLLAASGRQP